jgi:hypothetical protein
MVKTRFRKRGKAARQIPLFVFYEVVEGLPGG